MDFDVIDDDGMTITLAPLWVSILHTNFKVNLQDRFDAIAADIADADTVATNYPKSATAIDYHAAKVMAGVNTSIAVQLSPHQDHVSCHADTTTNYAQA